MVVSATNRQKKVFYFGELEEKDKSHKKAKL